MKELKSMKIAFDPIDYEPHPHHVRIYFAENM